jgi:hypothetical protein
MADPGRMTSEERKQAHALLTRVLSDPNWRTAGQALDDLMRKLLVIHRLLEAEERLARRKPGVVLAQPVADNDPHNPGGGLSGFLVAVD